MTLAGRPIWGPEIEVTRSGLEDVVISVAYDVGKISGKVDIGKTTVPEAGLLPRSMGVQLIAESNQAGWVERLFAATEPDGSYKIDGLPPGRYRAFVRVLEPGQFSMEDPDTIRKLAPWSKLVEVRSGQTTSLDLKPAPAVPEAQ